MSFINVYVHFVWATKSRLPLLKDNIRPIIFDHIRENAIKKNIHIDHMNGYKDHVHCLISLKDDLSIGKIAQLIKGESSYWINQNSITPQQFAWQNEYFAIGVSDDKLKIVREYIANQESHHQKTSFSQEYDKFIKRYGFDILKTNSG